MLYLNGQILENNVVIWSHWKRGEQNAKEIILKHEQRKWTKSIFKGRDNKKKKERKERKGAQKKREGKELLSFCSKIFYKIERKFKE